jgi:hypothetical protein
MRTEPFLNRAKSELALLRATITKSNAIAASMSRSYPLTVKNVSAAAKPTRLVSSRKRMLVDKRIHQRGSLFQNTRVIPDMRRKDRGLQQRFVLYSWAAAVFLDFVDDEWPEFPRS